MVFASFLTFSFIFIFIIFSQLCCCCVVLIMIVDVARAVDIRAQFEITPEMSD